MDLLQDRRDVLLRGDDALHLLFSQLDLLDVGAPPGLGHGSAGKMDEGGGEGRHNRETKSLSHPLAPRGPVLLCNSSPDSFSPSGRG